ncbi:hypothetical protein [Agriterribacter sp.]|uniref:hypothetical protein n=1 Tax=Agriterribacter sp. TaxID=2821509 RepID=UPI002BCB964A|nr:hypothetical protein [Agriterribacter sp.]HRO45130.1 hypothetical protein [Agriterribacter sp.]HRQ15429.1 hypothetical protein [Agriterribacter sp.]
MTKKEIDTLLLDKDICPANSHAPGFKDYLFAIDHKIKIDEYLISSQVFETLKKIYERYRDQILYGDSWVQSDHEGFVDSVTYQLNHVAADQEHRKIILRKLIDNCYMDLQAACQDIDPIFGSAPGFIESIESYWIYPLMNDGAELIRYIKFDLLKKGSFENFFSLYEERESISNFIILDSYFLSDSLNLVYKAISVKKNIEYLQKLIDDQYAPSSKIINKETRSRNPKPQPGAFEDIFCKPEYAEYAIQALRAISRPMPVIDIDNNYIGKGKGIFRVWIDALKQFPGAQIINQDLSIKVVAKLINTKIKGAGLDGSEFTHTYKKIEPYKNSITKKILETFSPLLNNLGRKGK